MSRHQHIAPKAARDDLALFAYGLSKKLGSQAETKKFLVAMHKCGLSTARNLIKRGESLAAAAAMKERVKS